MTTSVSVDDILYFAFLKAANKVVRCRTIQEVDKECEKINCDPTPNQLATESYKKAHINIKGLNITIENPRGSMRRKLRPDGSIIWESKMPTPYGYINGTIGSDFDQVDCMIGPHDKSKFVYIIDQQHPDSGKYDESKVMIWFHTAKQAKRAYFDMFADGSGKDRFLGISGLDFKHLKLWLCSNATLQSMWDNFKQAEPDMGKRGAPEDHPLGHPR